MAPDGSEGVCKFIQPHNSPRRARPNDLRVNEKVKKRESSTGTSTLPHRNTPHAAFMGGGAVGEHALMARSWHVASCQQKTFFALACTIREERAEHVPRKSGTRYSFEVTHNRTWRKWRWGAHCFICYVVMSYTVVWFCECKTSILLGRGNCANPTTVCDCCALLHCTIVVGAQAGFVWCGAGGYPFGMKGSSLWNGKLILRLQSAHCVLN